MQLVEYLEKMYDEIIKPKKEMEWTLCKCGVEFIIDDNPQNLWGGE